MCWSSQSDAAEEKKTFILPSSNRTALVMKLRVLLSHFLSLSVALALSVAELPPCAVSQDIWVLSP